MTADMLNPQLKCLTISILEPVWKLRGALFSGKRPDGATKENIPGGSSTEEQRSQTAFSAKTLQAAGLLSVAGVGSVVTARCGALRAAKAALATAKIPRRSAPRSFQTGSKQARCLPALFCRLPTDATFFATRRADWCFLPDNSKQCSEDCQPRFRSR